MSGESSKITLYHTGYLKLPNPDVHYGRVNADFGQGFYTTDDHAFSLRWAREKKGSDTIINQYVLDQSGLKIQALERNANWFDYIYRNRNRLPDRYPDADVIIGPIANDTLFDTMGVITSGLLSPEDSLKLLMVGPEYSQIVLKSEKATSQLKWVDAQVLSKEKLDRHKTLVAAEEETFLNEFAQVMETL